MKAHLPATHPDREPGVLRRSFSKLAVTRPLLFLSRNISWRLDPVLLRLSGGRISTTLLLRSGVLETRGARTGERRRNAVIYWHDGNRITIAASNAGAPRNPNWYHNVLADPEVTFNGLPMRARTTSLTCSAWPASAASFER
jgi:deazaflavin-dependent oxidoreductase (nitroreductase family)